LRPDYKNCPEIKIEGFGVKIAMSDNDYYVNIMIAGKLNQICKTDVA